LDDKKFTLMGDDGKSIGCLKGLPSGPLLLDFISRRFHKKFTLSQLMALNFSSCLYVPRQLTSK